MQQKPASCSDDNRIFECNYTIYRNYTGAKGSWGSHAEHGGEATALTLVSEPEANVAFAVSKRKTELRSNSCRL
jgi:hypothetical protein